MISKIIVDIFAGGIEDCMEMELATDPLYCPNERQFETGFFSTLDFEASCVAPQEGINLAAKQKSDSQIRGCQEAFVDDPLLLPRQTVGTIEQCCPLETSNNCGKEKRKNRRK